MATLISDKLGIPVIDGVSTAVKFIEALVGLRLSTSKTGDLAYPIAKTHWGILSTFTPARSSK